MTFLFYYANHAGAIRPACKKHEGIPALPVSRRASLFIYLVLLFKGYGAPPPTMSAGASERREDPSRCSVSG